MNIPKNNSASQEPSTESRTEFEHLNIRDLKPVRSLGRGTFARVDLVEVDGNPQRKYAMKTVPRRLLTAEDYEDLQRERENLGRCSSEFIVRLYRTYLVNESVSFLMEWCQGGDVKKLLESRKFFGEDCSKFYIGCVVEGLQYLHTRKIIHRDLKPQNLMLDGRGYAKIIDFGFSKDLSRGGRTDTICGTPHYVAPEMVVGKDYDHSIDYWSLGVIMFKLVGGTYPFSPIMINAEEIDKESVLKDRQIISFYPSAITWTLPGVRLVRNLLKTEPTERIGYRRGINELKSHAWFSGFDWMSLRARTMAPPFHPDLQEINNESDVNLWAGF